MTAGSTSTAAAFDIALTLGALLSTLLRSSVPVLVSCVVFSRLSMKKSPKVLANSFAPRFDSAGVLTLRPLPALPVATKEKEKEIRVRKVKGKRGEEKLTKLLAMFLRTTPLLKCSISEA